jgi:hypothetical protein
MKRTWFLLALVLTGWPAAAQTPVRDVVGRLIDRIVANEQHFVQQMEQARPLLEIYLQEVDEAHPDAPPVNDHYLLGRLDWSKDVLPMELSSSAAFQKRGGWPLFRHSASTLAFSAAGFAQMVVPDDEEFNRETYNFEFVRREFLGELRCLVLDVAPKDKKAAGRFIGRIWVEDRDYHLVRFNGTYTGSKAGAIFFHFDSWRVNVAPGVFVPAIIYVEDLPPAGPGGRRVRLKGHARLWGYKTVRPNKSQELTDILIEAENPVRDRSQAVDASPVEGQRSWLRQAEENILQRLEKSGLLAPPGEVDRVLNTVVNNLLATSNLDVEVQCRLLLTTPLESFAVGQTIVVSRGLVDVLPDEASLAMVLASELAHITLGHRTDTKFAFSDQTMFEEQQIVQRLHFNRPPPEVAEATQEAVQMLARSPYKDKLANAGLFLKALASRAPGLPNLIQANLSHQMMAGNELLLLTEVAAAAPELDESKVAQIAALPLGSRVKVDPWTNQTTLLKTKPVALLSAREKMPFEIAPPALYLVRVAPSNTAATQATQNMGAHTSQER